MTQSGTQPQVRIGDHERNQAMDLLGEHYAAGRLSKEEYDERVDAAWTARTRQGLDPLFWDLPSIAPKPVAPAPRARRRRRGPRAFVLLVVAALFVVAAIVKAPWWGWLIAAWVAASFFTGSHCGHRRGSWRT